MTPAPRGHPAPLPSTPGQIDAAASVDIGPDELELLARCGQRRRFPAGHVLARRGEPGAEVWIVLDGEVEARRDGATAYVAGGGDVVGERALLGGGDRAATLVVRADAEAFVLDLRTFQRAIHASDALRNRVERAVIAHTAN